MKIGKKEREQQILCDAWKHPVGTDVILTNDDGDQIKTKTRSEAWMLGSDKVNGYPGHTAVILLEGISGGYSLSRVRKA